jgi:transmembrane sensor
MSPSEDRAIEAIRETAAEWVVRSSGSHFSRTEKAELLEWLRRSPLHLQAYLHAEAGWTALDEAARSDGADVKTLVAQDAGNVVGLRPSSRAQDSSLPNRVPARFWNQWRVTVAAALVLAALVPFAPSQWFERLDRDAYSTGIGERRQIVLTDGSTIELNTRTRLAVRFSSGERRIELRAGEAFFSVAKDASRPFRVLSDDAVVQAIGTQFNVYDRAGGTEVTVLEGRIALASRESATAGRAQPMEVGAGSSARMKPESLPVVAATRSDAAVAWRQRRLVFEDEALGTVVDEFNRYNVRQIVVTDAALAARRISGIFDPHQPQDLVDFLTQHDDVRADESAERIVLDR